MIRFSRNITGAPLRNIIGIEREIYATVPNSQGEYLSAALIDFRQRGIVMAIIL